MCEIYSKDKTSSEQPESLFEGLAAVPGGCDQPEVVGSKDGAMKCFLSTFQVIRSSRQPVADLETYMNTLKTKKEQAEGWLKWVDHQKGKASTDVQRGPRNLSTGLQSDAEDLSESCRSPHCGDAFELLGAEPASHGDEDGFQRGS